MFREEELAKPLSNNTARIQLDGWHQLFKEYLPDFWNIPLYTTPQLSRNTGANEDRHLKCTSNYFEGTMKRVLDSVLVIILQIILSLIQAVIAYYCLGYKSHRCLNFILLTLECLDKWSEYEGISYKVVDRLGYPRRFDHFMAPKLLNGQC